MIALPLYPVWLVDLLGSAALIVFALLCLGIAREMARHDPANPLAIYFVWFCGAILAFSLSRSAGHIIKHIMQITGHESWWQRLSPISGSINTMTFVVIASVTLFFHRMQTIVQRMQKDGEKIEKTSRDLLRLNQEMEAIVSERTMAEIALHLAHEIRNPVTIIGGLLGQLARESKIPDPKRHRFALVLEQVHNLEALVSRFEDLNKARRYHFAVQDLNDLATRAVDLGQTEAREKGVGIIFSRSPGRLSFRGDPALIDTAIMHLLRNAIEVSPAGDAVEVTAAVADGQLQLRIDDHGPGIPAEDLKHIFEPFYRTRKGWIDPGLPYVRQIIQEHRGSLAIRSTVGKGTTVEIRLPTHLGELELS